MGENPTKYKRIRPREMAANAGHRAVTLHERVAGTKTVVEVDMDLGLKSIMVLQTGG